MFTLLAEMSLAERRRRLDEGHIAFEGAFDRLPEHLHHAALRHDFERACEAELQSISARDLFGKRMLDETASSGPMRRRRTNPFGEFLFGLAGTCDPDVISARDLSLSAGIPPPTWTPFIEWLGWLRGDDDSGDACYALLAGHARIGDDPEELLG